MQMKRLELVVTAESPWAVERGINYAVQQIERNNTDGEYFIEKHNTNVKWRMVDVSVAIPEQESILPPPPAQVPDISTMDIEEARGSIGIAGGPEELDAMEDFEVRSERFPGGRKGVLKYIDQRRKDMAEQAAARAASGQ